MNYERLFRLIGWIGWLDASNDDAIPKDSWEYMPQLLSFIKTQRVTYAEFAKLDEDPYNLGWLSPDGHEWHWKLRRLRNDPEYGKQLYTILEENNKAFLPPPS